MEQTAVEWLAEQVNTAKWKFADKTDRESIIEQAKEMEKRQIKEACIVIMKANQMLIDELREEIKRKED
jgi:hypothetical protein